MTVVIGSTALSGQTPRYTASQLQCARFLEHSRVYYFENAGDSEIYCSSADWLERNLLRRVETCFPLLDPDLARRVYDEELANYLADNTNAWELKSDGTYAKVQAGDAMPHSAQATLLARLCR